MKRTPLRRKPWRRALGTPEMRLHFKTEVLRLDGGCVMEGQSECEGNLQAAHVIPKQRLRREGFRAEVVYLPAAAMCLCERHHRRHDSGLEKVPYELTPERCKNFVLMIGFRRLAEQTA